ncbi:Type I inositol 1,4,5-trisphosphate 5-phosphatase [Liparis tanakae]|uniref:Type I inositol 1,4,5-trisphosphate 5-phosphatase n=1 Tax=Liparis tanakae TaxID=230148 RepID=A0A4Z2GXE6_9TELE|nr:Type I inositol 1,4,5-trisphosphate 5-phosphatase [Liparis tanakae]
MEAFTDVLLVTANVGSLFDNVGDIQNEWLQELYKTIHSHKPKFIALHFQEVGGKDYMANMGHADHFFRNIESSEEMKDFDRVCIYVDDQFQAEDRFTALGSLYFIHKTLKNIYQYDFNVQVVQKGLHEDPLDYTRPVRTEHDPHLDFIHRVKVDST